MSVRASFVERFGESDAAAIEAAANEHDNDVHPNRGSDPFKWAVCICIGYECMTRFREHHGIAATEQAIREWALEFGQLASHDGDVDYLAAFAGKYNEWIPASESAP